MANLNVPDRYKEGILKVGELSEEGFTQLRDALSKAPECQDSTELSSWLSDETSAVPPSDRQTIVSALAPMFRVQRNADVSAKVFVSDIWDALRRSSPELVRSISGSVLTSRLSELMEQNALDLPSTKLGDLKREVERSFCKVRILTDLRPAFKADISEAPVSMLILHNVQFGYHDGMGKHHEFYMTLDASDIKSLRKALDRAEEKAKTLTKALAQTKITLHK